MINQLIQEELKRSNTIHRPYFTSAHEGESIIREELDEVDETLDTVNMYYEKLWGNVKLNFPSEQVENVKMLEFYCKLAIEEMIQVSSMCRKFILSSESGWSDENKDL